MASDTENGRVNTGGITAGLIVLGLGVLMLLDRSGYSERHLMQYFPGVVLIVLGLASLTSASCSRRRRRPFGGLWLLLIGTWMIVSQGQLFGLTFHNSWPLLIIAVGLLIVARAVWPDGERIGPKGGSAP